MPDIVQRSPECQWLKVRKGIWKNFFHQENKHFLKLTWARRMLFWNHSQNFVEQVFGKFSLTIRKRLHFTIFSKKSLFSKHFWRRRMQFWEPCRHFSAMSANVFRTKQQKVYEKINFWKELLSALMLLWTCEKQVWQHSLKTC